MDLNPYVDELRRQVAIAADAGGEEARAVAERLLAPLESAIRLTLLDALSAAADEITSELAPGSVDLRLRAGEPSFVVTGAPANDRFDDTPAGAPPSDPPPLATPEGDEGDEGATLRINFRLPDHLKARIEAAAERSGLSVNSWLVRVTGAAVQVEGLGPQAGPSTGKRDGWGRQRHTGWVR